MLRSRVSCEGGPTAREREAGVSLFIAVMTGLVAMSLGTVVASTVVLTNRNSGLDRQSAMAISAAEAGVDAAYAAIQAAAADKLPCQMSFSAGNSEVAAVNSAITYYAQNGSTVPCVGGFVPSASASSVARAKISAKAGNALTGGGARGERAMESLVNVSAQTSNQLVDAIFANSSLRFANNTRLLGANGDDANVYSNNLIACTNGNANTRFDGSFYAHGDVEMAAQCQVTGDVWTTGTVRLNNSAVSIGGYVRSSRGSIIAVPENTTRMVGRLAEASTISWDACWTNSSRTTLRNPARCNWVAPADPPTRDFPQIRGDAAAQAAWAADGYTVRVINNSSSPVSCSSPDVNGLSGATNWIVQNADKWTGKNLVVVNCPNTPVRFQNLNGKKIALAGDLAIMAYGGIVSAGSTEFTSASGTPRNLHLIVPYDAATSPTNCSTPTLQLDNQTLIQPSLSALLYTPCNSYVSNNATLNGQIYAGGSLDINNMATIQYKPVGLPPEAVIGSGGGLDGFKLDVVYKRERS